MKISIIAVYLVIAAIAIGSPVAAQLDTSFTYQGELQENGLLSDGSFEMAFSLWSAANAGNQIGAPIVLNEVPVLDGRFSAQLDFGAGALDNSDRWLQIAINGVTLAPRNPITRAPYAIQTRGINVADDQDVSIGTPSNLYRFQVFTVDRERAIYGNNLDNSGGNKFGVYGRATAVSGYGVFGLHDASTGTNAGVYGETDSTTANAVGVHGVVDTTVAGGFSAAVRGENRGTGLSGIGVHGSHAGQGWGLYGSTDGGFGRGVFGEVLGDGGVAGYFSNDDGIAVFADGADNDGATAALNVVSGTQTMLIDGNEIDSNSTAGLFLNNNNANDVVLADGGGDVVLSNPDSVLRAEGSITAQGPIAAQGPISARNLIIGNNQNVFTPLTASMDSDQDFQNTYIVFISDGNFVGSITSFQGVASYNAFTGSHYVSIRDAIEPGMLVRMTGVNHAVSDSRASEIVYGVETATLTNDPACLGAYVGDHGDLHTESGTKIHLVAAAGNGTVWVVDDGRGNIEPGDLLISSNIPGCAMKDDPARFTTGHVIARAAQRTDWADVTPESGGVKRIKLSVLFDASVRTAPATDASLPQKIADQQAAMDALLLRLESLESALVAKETQQ